MTGDSICNKTNSSLLLLQLVNHLGPQKTSIEAQGLFLAQVKIIGKNISFVLKTDTTLDFSQIAYQDNIAIKLWFEAAEGIYAYSREL